MQEQLDGAGIELPTLYKWIECQAPDGCHTEAWKKRAHWVGSQVTSEFSQSVRDAEDYLHSRRPVRRYIYTQFSNYIALFCHVTYLLFVMLPENMVNCWRKVLVDF